MTNTSCMLVAAGAALTALALFNTAADAQPRGWKCSYAFTPIIGPFSRGSNRYTYACYGRSLRQTRAWARAQCRNSPSCETGACLPLDYTPRPRCERD